MYSSRTEILNDGGLRVDVRRPYELRSTTFRLGTHPACDGSATAIQGLTHVQVSIFGPREPQNRAQVNHDRASVVVEVGIVPWVTGGGAKKTRGDKRLQEIGAAIRQTFEPVIMTQLYPRSEIAIDVQIVDSRCTGILPIAINATTLALLDAGISILDYVTSVSVGLHLKQPLLDLCQPEESDIPFVVIASLPTSGKITLAQMETRLHVDLFEKMLKLGVEACKVLKAEMDENVKRRTEQVVERMNIKVGGGEGSMTIDD
nr:exosome complex component RRP41 [Cryptococcus depauperatus CBS 7855]